ncbi:MAG: serine/threonine-protein kinase [Thermoanaerobaculia bacterium]|nr:serine/threonine-protein kinase [Thermoanaerobaculia bacterium]
MSTSGPHPERIHRYEILSELGRGAMGRVYLARDPNIDRKIALKVLAPRQLVDEEEEEELRRRFLREARAAGGLQHPGIVMVLDADTDPASGAPYIAMEWVDGSPLRQILRKEGPLPVPVSLGLARRVAEALAFAHDHGIVHRDIKPANLLVSREGKIKISDFGIARVVSSTLTRESRTLGTPFYMSPEQVRGEKADHRTDLFSLGIVLYECLTGRPPFTGETLASVTYKILEVDPRPPELFREDLPSGVSDLVLRAVAKDPEDRFQSAGEMAKALEVVDRAGTPHPASTPVSAEPPPESQSSPRSRPKPAVPADDVPEPITARMYMTAWDEEGPPESGHQRRRGTRSGPRGRRSRKRRRIRALFLGLAILAVVVIWILI